MLSSANPERKTTWRSKDFCATPLNFSASLQVEVPTYLEVYTIAKAFLNLSWQRSANNAVLRAPL